jgi:hypothetical protein
VPQAHISAAPLQFSYPHVSTVPLALLWALRPEKDSP